MQTYVKENVHPGELEVYEVLNELAAVYNSQFSALELPYALTINPKERQLTLPHYKGLDFNSRWSEADGGALLDNHFSRKVIDVITDLSIIDTQKFTRSRHLQKRDQLVFNHSKAVPYYTHLLEQFQRADLISRESASSACTLLAYKQTSPMIVNNGDFYPRNFIERPDGRMLLIDWETWNAHSPFFVVDHPENIAAVMYVHMWSNSSWLQMYRAQLTERFGFEERSFSKGVVMKSLQLANLWFGRPGKDQLVTSQLDMCKEELQRYKS